jgi:hypothetical protein
VQVQSTLIGIELELLDLPGTVRAEGKLEEARHGISLCQVIHDELVEAVIRSGLTERLARLYSHRNTVARVAK